MLLDFDIFRMIMAFDKINEKTSFTHIHNNLVNNNLINPIHNVSTVRWLKRWIKKGYVEKISRGCYILTLDKHIIETHCEFFTLAIASFLQSSKESETQ